MAATDGTLGTLLQGVSQQPASVRPDGKVTEQINLQSDIVEGLTARPALVDKAVVANSTVPDFKFLDIELEGETFIVGHKANQLAIWGTDGTSYSLVEGDAGALSYIGDNMRPYVFEKTLFLSNRDVVVAKAAAPDMSTVLANAGIVFCLGGAFSRTYTLEVRHDDGTRTEVSYTTPDGTSSGHAAQTSAEHIIGQLNAALIGSIGDFPAGTTIDPEGRNIYIQCPTPFTINVSDDEDGTLLRAFTDKVEGVEDLSATAPHGMTVRVTNSDEGNQDDYYLRFNSDITDVIGDGFGDGGVWEEWFNAAEVTAFDLTTMPHVIEKTGATEFTLSRGQWASRQVGDEETNPFPNLIGNAIRDINGFQSRLVFVAGPFCLMSQTNRPLDFFKKSALTELSTDPIDITSTEEGTVTLDWIIPFDRDLVFMSDPGKGQFIIDGSTTMTPTNGSMVQTTSFEMRGGAKPIETGRTVLFPFKSGIYSGINEFFTNDEVATNGADTLTETLDRYLIGLVDHMRASTNFNMAVFKTDDAATNNTVYVYKYLWRNTEKIQSSWSKWTFPLEVRHFFFDGSELFVVMSEDAVTPGQTNYVFAALDLDIPIDANSQFHICLDRQVTRTADATSTVQLPYDNAFFIQGNGCLTPGREVTPQSSTPLDGTGQATYTFDPTTVPENATVVCGLKYQRLLKPTMPFARGRDGRPLPRTHIVVTSFLIEYEDTGYIKTINESRYRATPTEFEVDFFPLDADPIDTQSNGVRSGILDVPWGERADWSELTIVSDDVRPTTIIEIEWVGQVFKGSRQ